MQLIAALSSCLFCTVTFALSSLCVVQWQIINKINCSEVVQYIIAMAGDCLICVKRMALYGIELR